MCEVNIYVKGKDGKESLVLADVYLIQPQGDTLRIENIFGEQKFLEMEIEEISLIKGKILLVPR